MPEALNEIEPLQHDEVDHDWFGLLARDDQVPPLGDWRTWLILGGRGAGKTRAGAEWVKARATGQGLDTGTLARRIAIVAPTFDEARMVMIEGVSGLLQPCRGLSVSLGAAAAKLFPFLLTPGH